MTITNDAERIAPAESVDSEDTATRLDTIEGQLDGITGSWTPST